MSVCRFALAAGVALVIPFAPTVAEAAPFLVGATPGEHIAGSSCAVVGVADISTRDCGLFTIDPFAPGTISGGLEYDNDVALFQFVLTAEANLAAFTSGFATTGFDPLMGLFYAADTTVGGTTIAAGTMVQYADPTGTASVPARSRDISDVNYDDVLPDPDLQPSLLLGPGSYVLALLQFGNDFHAGADGLDSLLAGFHADGVGPDGTIVDGFTRDFNGGCAGSNRCDFTLGVSASPTASVPEPGTLALVAVGSLAAAAMRRRTSRPRA